MVSEPERGATNRWTKNGGPLSLSLSPSIENRGTAGLSPGFKTIINPLTVQPLKPLVGKGGRRGGGGQRLLPDCTSLTSPPRSFSPGFLQLPNRVR